MAAMPRTLALALSIATAALALPSGVAAKGAVLLPPALGRTDEVWIAGRVLRDAPPAGGSPAARNGGALAARNRKGARVEIAFLGREAAGVSGHDGEFEVAIRAGDAPFPPGPQPVEVRSRGAVARGVVHVVAPDAPFLVVSDLDDTVAVTNVGSTRKMLAATFLEDADTQPAVPGMAELYRCLAASRPAPAFAIVSGSPVQLAPRVARFLERNGFPPAALFLRNLGPSSLSGYKEPVLRRIADRFPQPLVLVGDSGERDPEIYAALARDRPGRVRAIFIRRAREPAGPPGRFSGELLFADAGEARARAAADGLAPPGCGTPPLPPAGAR
jgi:hypothetical protein